MDPFQIRLECVALLRRLTASQQSISKVVDYAIRYATTASDDIWDCIVSECSKTTLNARLNILFLVDALLLQIVDPIGFSASSTGSSSSSSLSTVNLAQAAMAYLALAVRDIRKVILQGVVPSDNWDAVRLNASSTEKILASWKRLNIFDHAVLDELMVELHTRKTELSKLPSSTRVDFSNKDVLRRIDEDRERHKRLRERAWILPAKSFANGMTSVRLAATTPSKPSSRTGNPDALDVEFDYVWDNLSDLNEDDMERIREDDSTWWGSEQEAKEHGGKAAATASSVTGPEKRHWSDNNSSSYESASLDTPSSKRHQTGWT